MGTPETLLEGVDTDSITGGANFTLSQNGMLVYRTAGSLSSRLTWIDRTGRTLPPPVTETEREALMFTLSHDERFAMVTRINPATGKTDLWRLDLTRGLSTRLISNAQWNTMEPALSPTPTEQTPSASPATVARVRASGRTAESSST